VSAGAADRLLVLGAWSGLTVALVGVGLLARRLWRDRAQGADAWLRSFWVGWVMVLFALQLWQLFFPVGHAVVGVAAVGVCGVALEGARPWRVLWRGARRNLPVLIAAVLAALWLSNRALGGAQNGDSGLYYLPTIRWLAAHPIIPGLGNLQDRLAFNQSYFLYAALLEVGRFAQGSHHLANGLLVLGLLTQTLLGLFRLLRPSRPLVPQDLFYALFLPVAVELGLDLNLTSPAPDLAIFIVGVVLVGQLVSLLSRPASGAPAPSPNAPDPGLCAIAVLAVAGITIKLSFIGLAATVVLVALPMGVRGAPRPRQVRSLVAMAALGLLGLGPWLVRGLVQSGYPAYPSTFGALDVNWRVPMQIAVDQTASIQVWPGGLVGGLKAAFSSLPWLRRTLESAGCMTLGVQVPLALAAVAGLAIAPLRWLRRRAEPPRLSALALVPALGAFLFWAALAPRPRYAGATFWLLAVTALVLAIDAAVRSKAGWPGRIAALVTVAALMWLPLSQGKPLLRDLRGFEVNAVPPVSQVVLADGTKVAQPLPGRSCWNTPPPCGQEVLPGLTLRRPGDLRSGFRIDRDAPAAVMVAVPAAELDLGCAPARDPSCAPTERPQTRVRVAAFALDRTEVTQSDYQRCVGRRVCTPPASGFDPAQWPKRPVAQVTWAQASAYCQFAGKRLPSEAEWELAARGTDGRIYPWGDSAPTCAQAHTRACGDQPQDVGLTPAGASPFGALDLAGNVDEWVDGFYAPYGSAPTPQRVARGGAYDAWHARTTARNALAPDYHDALLGFRCAR